MTNEQERALQALERMAKDHPCLRLGQVLANALDSHCTTLAGVYYMKDEMLADALEAFEKSVSSQQKEGKI